MAGNERWSAHSCLDPLGVGVGDGSDCIKVSVFFFFFMRPPPSIPHHHHHRVRLPSGCLLDRDLPTQARSPSPRKSGVRPPDRKSRLIQRTVDVDGPRYIQHAMTTYVSVSHLLLKLEPEQLALGNTHSLSLSLCLPGQPPTRLPPRWPG